MLSSACHLFRQYRTVRAERLPFRPRRFVLSSSLIFALIMAGCTTLPLPASPQAHPAALAVELPSSVVGPPEQAAPALIAAEREAARARDLRLLAALWAPDARIIDGRGTDSTADDYRWEGRDAILDRYVIAVFPSPPPPLAPSTLTEIEVITDTDRLAHAALGVDHWTFVRLDGAWRLLELRYN